MQLTKGISTSEIWLVIVYGFVSYFFSTIGVKVPVEMEQGIAAAIVAYILSRTALKMRFMKTNPPVVPAQPKYTATVQMNPVQ